MSCQIVKRVTGTCNTTPAPSNIETKGHGPFFYSTNDWATVNYYFDGLAYPQSLWNEPWKPPEKCSRSTRKYLYSLVFFSFLINRKMVLRQKKRHFLHSKLHCLSEKKHDRTIFQTRLDMCGQQWERNCACDTASFAIQQFAQGQGKPRDDIFQKANILSFQGLTASFAILQGVFFLPYDRKYPPKGSLTCTDLLNIHKI